MESSPHSTQKGACSRSRPDARAVAQDEPVVAEPRAGGRALVEQFASAEGARRRSRRADRGLARTPARSKEASARGRSSEGRPGLAGTEEVVRRCCRRANTAPVGPSPWTSDAALARGGRDLSVTGLIRRTRPRGNRATLPRRAAPRASKLPRRRRCAHSDRDRRRTATVRSSRSRSVPRPVTQSDPDSHAIRSGASPGTVASRRTRFVAVSIATRPRSRWLITHARSPRKTRSAGPSPTAMRATTLRRVGSIRRTSPLRSSTDQREPSPTQRL